VVARLYEKALASIADSLLIAHPFTLSLVLTFSAVLHLSLVEAVEALVAEQRLSLPFEPGIVHGAALVGQGAGEEAIARLREGVTKSTQLGRPYGLAFLAEGLAWHGDRAAALAALQEGLEIARTTGEQGWDAELRRLAGTVLLAENKLNEGEASSQHSRKLNKQSHSNCAPSAISPGCEASKVGAPKPATSSPQSIAGLPKDSTPPT